MSVKTRYTASLQESTRAAVLGGVVRYSGTVEYYYIR